MMDDTPDALPATGRLTIAAAGRMLRGGMVTSVELTERCLRQIDRVEPALHACITVLRESALASARAADEVLRAQRPRSPLHGIPLGIKDIIATRGVRTTAGSRVLENWTPDDDAEVVARLIAAGMVPICKTNTHEFAFGTLTPPTRNPWQTDRVPGGSSGGSAVALATGECLGALGTDTGGSIRIPAGWCGVTGLKPTYGLVSRAGIIPLSWSLDHAGPLALTVEDCALLLDALAGYDPRDPDSADVPLLSYSAALAPLRTPEDAVRGMRVGVPTNYFFDPVDAEVRAAVYAAAEQLRALGATVEEVALPSLLDELFPVYRAIQKPEAYVYHTDQGWLETRADRYAPAVLANISSGADYSAAEYVRAQHTRRAFTDGMRAVFQRVDALLTPTLAIPAPRIADYDQPLRVGKQELIGGAMRCTFPFDLTGQPALALPCGFSRDGLPLSMQLVAGHFGESTLLRLGHAYQRVTDWHTRVPAAFV